MNYHYPAQGHYMSVPIRSDNSPVQTVSKEFPQVLELNVIVVVVSVPSPSILFCCSLAIDTVTVLRNKTVCAQNYTSRSAKTFQFFLIRSASILKYSISSLCEISCPVKRKSLLTSRCEFG